MSEAIKGVAYSFEISLIDALGVDGYRLNPAFVAGDVKVSKDGATPVNITALPVAIAGTFAASVNLTANEMDADRLLVLFSDQDGEWKDFVYPIQTTSEDVAKQSTALAIKAKTDLLPASPAAVGSAMSLTAGSIGSATFTPDAISETALSSATAEKIAGAVDSTVQPRFTSVTSAVNTRLATSDYVAPDNTGIEALVQLAHADRHIDTTVDAGWQHVLIFAGQELLRQNMLDVHGNPVRNINSIVASVVS